MKTFYGRPTLRMDDSVVLVSVSDPSTITSDELRMILDGHPGAKQVLAVADFTLYAPSESMLDETRVEAG